MSWGKTWALVIRSGCIPRVIACWVGVHVRRPSVPAARCGVWINWSIGWRGQVEVEGEPADTEQPTLDLLPTLMEATLLGQQQQPLGRLVDAVVDVQSGRINHCLVARSDPRLPGSSR